VYTHPTAETAVKAAASISTSSGVCKQSMDHSTTMQQHQQL
jgi:hypothetical protein